MERRRWRRRRRWRGFTWHNYRLTVALIFNFNVQIKSESSTEASRRFFYYYFCCSLYKVATKTFLFVFSCFGRSFYICGLLKTTTLKHVAAYGAFVYGALVCVFNPQIIP